MRLTATKSCFSMPQGIWGSWLLTVRWIAFALSCGIGFLVFCTVALAIILTPEQYIHVSYDRSAGQTPPLVITVPGQAIAQTQTQAQALSAPQDSNWDGAATGCGVGSLYGRFIPGTGPYVAGILGAVIGFELDRRL